VGELALEMAAVIAELDQRVEALEAWGERQGYRSRSLRA
jgi:hypothetical protein